MTEINTDLPVIELAESKDVLIAVMGMIGSGKTTFISKVTGRQDLEIDHEPRLNSCTQEIQIIETTLDGRTVRFIDTPGFSDSYFDVLKVFAMMADYLAAAYSRDMRLSGVIYLHPLSDDRVAYRFIENLEIFQKLTGEKNLENVILTTTMWDDVTPKVGKSREEELRSKFENASTEYGLKYAQHDGSTHSAQQIASRLVNTQPFYLQLQEEVGKWNMDLKDTAAGKEIIAQLLREKEKQRLEFAELQDFILQTSTDENQNDGINFQELHSLTMQGVEDALNDKRWENKSEDRSLEDRIKEIKRRGLCDFM
ncbi:P-loop containing nucleoside triphosphate hydrolase protein [Hypoxylon sp. NC1633]|nr:P-loop containing nucleoside triphosphate hydrolase protein [Hypoxylon sp. NC1633]